MPAPSHSPQHPQPHSGNCPGPSPGGQPHPVGLLLKVDIGQLQDHREVDGLGAHAPRLLVEVDLLEHLARGPCQAVLALCLVTLAAPWSPDPLGPTPGPPVPSAPRLTAPWSPLSPQSRAWLDLVTLVLRLQHKETQAETRDGQLGMVPAPWPQRPAVSLSGVLVSRAGSGTQVLSQNPGKH